jgi:mono/diheme cytochrome c family protein
LLYTTNCVGCHTTQVHWREKRLASDWAALIAQVERWQVNGKLGWSADDVAAVARYLNATFYHYPMPAGKAIGVRGGPERIARRD